MRKLANIWAPILILGVFLMTIYFKQWFVTARTIRTIQTAQEADIAMLDTAKTAIQDISALQMTLRMKLFGTEAAEEALLSARPTTQTPSALPPSVISSMKRNAVRLVYYRAGRETEIQLEGKFEDVVRFLDAARADLPRTKDFVMERGAADTVKLTLSLSTKIS